MAGVAKSASRRRAAVRGSAADLRWLSGALLIFALCSPVTAADAPTGTVGGRVTLEGKPPKSRPLDLSSDPNCLEIAGRKVKRQELVVGRDGGLANVFVRLAGEGLGAAAGPVPEDPVVIEQRGCIYYPRMTGARAGQTLRVVNSDNFSHNVRSVSEVGSDFNIGQPVAGLEFDFELVDEEPMLRLRCDMHPWMFAFVGVVGHPWFAVTGEDGRFELAGVPPGDYEVVLWHEELGVQRRDVTVAPGAVATVDFSLAAPPGG